MFIENSIYFTIFPKKKAMSHPSFTCTYDQHITVLDHGVCQRIETVDYAPKDLKQDGNVYTVTDPEPAVIQLTQNGAVYSNQKFTRTQSGPTTTITWKKFQDSLITDGTNVYRILPCGAKVLDTYSRRCSFDLKPYFHRRLNYFPKPCFETVSNCEHYAKQLSAIASVCLLVRQKDFDRKLENSYAGPINSFVHGAYDPSKDRSFNDRSQLLSSIQNNFHALRQECKLLKTLLESELLIKMETKLIKFATRISDLRKEIDTQNYEKCLHSLRKRVPTSLEQTIFNETHKFEEQVTDCELEVDPEAYFSSFVDIRVTALLIKMYCSLYFLDKILNQLDQNRTEAEINAAYDRCTYSKDLFINVARMAPATLEWPSYTASDHDEFVLPTSVSANTYEFPSAEDIYVGSTLEKMSDYKTRFIQRNEVNVKRFRTNLKTDKFDVMDKLLWTFRGKRINLEVDIPELETYTNRKDLCKAYAIAAQKERRARNTAYIMLFHITRARNMSRGVDIVKAEYIKQLEKVILWSHTARGYLYALNELDENIVPTGLFKKTADRNHPKGAKSANIYLHLQRLCVHVTRPDAQKLIRREIKMQTKLMDKAINNCFNADCSRYAKVGRSAYLHYLHRNAAEDEVLKLGYQKLDFRWTEKIKTVKSQLKLYVISESSDRDQLAIDKVNAVIQVSHIDDAEEFVRAYVARFELIRAKAQVYPIKKQIPVWICQRAVLLTIITTLLISVYYLGILSITLPQAENRYLKEYNRETGDLVRELITRKTNYQFHVIVSVFSLVYTWFIQRASQNARVLQDAYLYELTVFIVINAIFRTFLFLLG